MGIRNVVTFDILLEEEAGMYENVCFHMAGEIYVAVVGGFTDADMHAEVYYDQLWRIQELFYQHYSVPVMFVYYFIFFYFFQSLVAFCIHIVLSY